jgi:hypothetical protein
MIHDYKSRPGEHCGSTAMRNLIHHYCGLDLSEPAIFGLGSGIDFLMLESDAYQPAILILGRGASLETDVASALEIDYREQPEADDDEAWERVRHEVLEGRPTMLSGDSFYLDHRDFRAHFPSHRFVLLGFDDAVEKAFVADRLDPEPQACSYGGLRLSRNPPDFLSFHNLWGKFHDTRARRPIQEAIPAAIAESARRMLGGEAAGATASGILTDSTLRVSRGLAGLASFAERLPEWRDREDLELLAAYASRCIERYGTGGGNFRVLYAAFLQEARAVVPERVDAEAPELAARSAERWTELSQHFRDLGQSRSRDASERCSRSLSEILGLETRLFESLAEAV